IHLHLSSVACNLRSIPSAVLLSPVRSGWRHDFAAAPIIPGCLSLLSGREWEARSGQKSYAKPQPRGYPATGCRRYDETVNGVALITAIRIAVALIRHDTGRQRYG